jgi:hypothetical protein
MNEVHLTAENVANTDVKDLASEPAKPQPLTRKQLGQLRRRYLTVVHGTVRACGHKFNSRSQPKLNCNYCWDAYFMTAVDTAAIHDDLMKGGKAQLVNVYGTKFTKQFGRFLTEQLTAEQESNGQADSMVPTGDRPEASDDTNIGFPDDGATYTV